MRYLPLTLAMSFLVAGCNILEDEVERGYAQRALLTAATFTTADVRVITQRTRPYSSDPIVCTEPSPDVAKALSTAAEASGSVAGKGSFGAGGASAEAVAALAGRSTALLGLRDGLYRACEAYANGVIGADAYALVLSRYGQLMTTLFLGQDVTGAAGTEAGASIQSPPVNLTINPSGASTVTAGQAQNPSAPAPSSPGSQVATTAGSSSTGPLALTRMNEDYLNLGYNPDALIIACINYGDTSRIPSHNRYLDNICTKIFGSTLEPLQQFADAARELVNAQVLAAPVNPAAAATQIPPTKQPAKVVTPTKPKPATPAEVELAQDFLKKASFDPGDHDPGKPGSNLKEAVTAYQKSTNGKLKVTGGLDEATLKALKVR